MESFYERMEREKEKREREREGEYLHAFCNFNDDGMLATFCSSYGPAKERTEQKIIASN